ncbi:UNKNOWN [Stylonychia lemnae]|uniref:Uncharacterized protein n=1 Tax=Stylonychia lemnae TaxID=5949 RepID=A0A078AH23_STYLE|nr:UNKNOWN [Stylonychia lemnae]|eukprot:CDW80817.1 UNKNOWN [Stylonychia lemnae]
MEDFGNNQSDQKHEYSIKKAKALGKLIKSEVEKLRQLKKIKKSQEQEKREVLRSLESILENTLDMMSTEDARYFLTRKINEFQIKINTNPANADLLSHNIVTSLETPQLSVEDQKTEDIKSQEIPEVQVEGQTWEKIGENFSDVSMSQDGQIFAIGSQSIGYGGNAIYQFVNGGWVQIPGEAVKISAYKQGEIWSVNTSGKVWQKQNDQWVARSDIGTAADVAVGDDGSVWITCAQQTKDKGINIMYYDFSSQKFMKVNGFGQQIAVTRNGEPLIVLENGEVILRKGREIQKINIFATNVSITRLDELWAVSASKVDGGYQIYKGQLQAEITWEDMQISGVKVSAYDKTAIIVNEWGEVYRYRN